MDPRTAEEVDFVVHAPLGLGLQADLIMRLLTRENVGEVMVRLPFAFRQEFITFAREAYVPEGERVVMGGAAIPVASLDALRSWLRQADAVDAAGRAIPAEPFDDSAWASLWAETSVAYAQIRADRAIWADEQEEYLTWDAALNDSLGDDAYAEAG